MKLSIVTINYNNAEGLHKTMESVFAQACHDFEYIIVDGASTDGSVDVIRAAALQAERLTFSWVSEKDSGIYNAMNKGIEIASGLRVVNALNRSERSEDKNKELPEYVLMLNSGDYLVDERVIERIMPELDGTDIVQGNNIEERNGHICRNRGYGKSDIDMNDVLQGHFLHQASFCRRDLFDRYGYFDESYRIAGDTKFFMNCLGVHNATFMYVDIDVVNYDCNGISALQCSKWIMQGKTEYMRIVGELFSQRLVNYIEDSEKKINLYNNLHHHKWIWNLTMALAHLHNRIYGELRNDTKKEIVQ